MQLGRREVALYTWAERRQGDAGYRVVDREGVPSGRQYTLLSSATRGGGWGWGGTGWGWMTTAVLRSLQLRRRLRATTCRPPPPPIHCSF